MGSRDFVLDRLMKLKEDVQLDEAVANKKTAKTVAIGDTVHGYTDNKAVTKKVKSKIANRNNYFKITFDDGSDTIVHGGHEFSLAEETQDEVNEAYKKSPADDYDLEMDNLERDKKIIKKLDKNAITSLLKYYGADASKTKMSAYSGSTTYKAYMNAFDKRAIELGIKEGVELEELLGGDIPQLDEDFIKKVNDALSNR
jgi:hypothetical protein